MLRMLSCIEGSWSPPALCVSPILCSGLVSVTLSRAKRVPNLHVRLQHSNTELGLIGAGRSRRPRRKSEAGDPCRPTKPLKQTVVFLRLPPTRTVGDRYHVHIYQREFLASGEQRELTYRSQACHPG